MSCLFHRWGHWKRYELPVQERRLFGNWGLAGGVEEHQRKVCQDCGKIKDEYIGFREGARKNERGA